MVKVKVILVDDQGRIKLSRRQALAELRAASGEPAPAAAPAPAH
jgi:predicted RNA-binding protein with RPS1 domain